MYDLFRTRNNGMLHTLVLYAWPLILVSECLFNEVTIFCLRLYITYDSHRRTAQTEPRWPPYNSRHAAANPFTCYHLRYWSVRGHASIHIMSTNLPQLISTMCTFATDILQFNMETRKESDIESSEDEIFITQSSFRKTESEVSDDDMCVAALERYFTCIFFILWTTLWNIGHQ